MVDVLAAVKHAAKMFLHDRAVLKNVVISDFDSDVAVGADKPPGVLACGSAYLAAELASPNVAWLDVERD